MSLNYRLVRRPDMRKDAAEGSKLYYAQVRSLKKLKFEKFCNMVAVRSSAFVGDVKLVIDGILSVMEERLEEGDVIQLGRLGNFRMVAGSKGVENEADFNTSHSNISTWSRPVTNRLPEAGRRNRVNCRPEAKFKQTKKLF